MEILAFIILIGIIGMIVGWFKKYILKEDISIDEQASKKDSPIDVGDDPSGNFSHWTPMGKY